MDSDKNNKNFELADLESRRARAKLIQNYYDNYDDDLENFPFITPKKLSSYTENAEHERVRREYVEKLLKVLQNNAYVEYYKRNKDDARVTTSSTTAVEYQNIANSNVNNQAEKVINAAATINAVTANMPNEMCSSTVKEPTTQTFTSFNSFSTFLPAIGSTPKPTPTPIFTQKPRPTPTPLLPTLLTTPTPTPTPTPALLSTPKLLATPILTLKSTITPTPAQSTITATPAKSTITPTPAQSTITATPPKSTITPTPAQSAIKHLPTTAATSMFDFKSVKKPNSFGIKLDTAPTTAAFNTNFPFNTGINKQLTTGFQPNVPTFGQYCQPSPFSMPSNTVNYNVWKQNEKITNNGQSYPINNMQPIFNNIPYNVAQKVEAQQNFFGLGQNVDTDLNDWPMYDATTEDAVMMNNNNTVITTTDTTPFHFTNDVEMKSLDDSDTKQSVLDYSINFSFGKIRAAGAMSTPKSF